jgi:hypothetical protein
LRLRLPEKPRLVPEKTGEIRKTYGGKERTNSYVEKDFVEHLDGIFTPTRNALRDQNGLQPMGILELESEIQTATG